MLRTSLLALACLTSLSFCSCRHMPKSETGNIPQDTTAAMMPPSSSPATGNQIGNVAPRAERANFVAPADPTASPTMIQRLSHSSPAAAPQRQMSPGESLAPIVNAAPQQPVAQQPVVQVPPSPPAPAQFNAGPMAGRVVPVQYTADAGGNAVQLAPGEVIVEGGQVFTENPPAGMEYEWRPAASCGCNPQCGPGTNGQSNCPTRQPHITAEEYLCDGGDVKAQVRVMKNFDVRNIDMTDTVAHFDTLDGKRLVEKSNRVCIYAPRFGAVRRIDGLMSDDVLRGVRGIRKQLQPLGQDRHAIVGSMLQPVQPEGKLGNQAANALLEKEGGLNVENIYAATEGSNPRPAFENFEIIQRGVYLNSDKPRLQEHVEAALTWMTYESVEVMINQRKAQQVQQKSRAQETFVYEIDGKPRLRICKVASTDNAQPGDTVDFTIRYDNIGDQKIGNVTILDSLTTRLEYVPDSQTSTLEADFFAIQNEGESLVLRWEIKAPMKVGEGGIIRFKCKVR